MINADWSSADMDRSADRHRAIVRVADPDTHLQRGSTPGGSSSLSMADWT